MYVVVHTASGSYDGTIAWQRNPQSQISSHFIVAKDGRIGQMLDTNAKGWTQIEGNPFSISIENEGNENTPLTAAQIEACAQILARAHAVHGVPLQLTGKVGVRGLGHHSMGAESGVNWGHSQCPGNIIKGQKPQILARAQQLAGGGIVLTSTVTQGYSMTDSENIAHIRAELDRALNGFAANGDGTSNLLPAWISGFQQAQNTMSAQLAAIAAKVGAPAQVTLTDAQLATITAAIVAHPQTPLGDADKPAIEQAVAAAFGKAFPSP